MAVIAYVFNPLAQSLMAGELGVLDASTTIKCALFGPTYVPDPDFRYLDQLQGEIVDASYARQTLTGVVVTYSATTDTTTLDANDVTFPNLSATVRYVCFFRDVGGAAATSPLICFWDLGADEVSAAAPYVVTLPALGLVTMTKAV